jgi:hypothetical protein
MRKSRAGCSHRRGRHKQEIGLHPFGVLHASGGPGEIRTHGSLGEALIRAANMLTFDDRARPGAKMRRSQSLPAYPF